MKYLQQLEFPKIKEIISTACHSEMGRKLAYKLNPITNRQEIETKLKTVSEALALSRQGIRYNFTDLADLKKLLLEFEHKLYNFEEFHQIIHNQNLANRFYNEKFEEKPLLQEIFASIQPLPELVERFNEIYNNDGDIKDSASDKLRNIRNRKRALRKNIMQALNKKVEQFEKNNYLHDKIITQREGRYVIPVKEGSASFVQGIVHARSTSKSSLFMEPTEIVEQNNELEIISGEEKREIYRILKDFTQTIQISKYKILTNSEILGNLDFIFAVAQISMQWNCNIPTITSEPYIKLKKARHPLLINSYGDIKKVIPFEVELGKDFRILLISGPNTGGKTVTLKTIGLLTIMALSGLPIPASIDSEIGIFESFFADIGDAQSLENSLSTFSSHISNIDEMLKKGNACSLVLIDEIGAATDPEQGSALAQVILEKLTEIKVIAVITTHYTALKVFAEKSEHCCNAAMQFNSKQHSPTYHFKLGLPGNSFAIEVASKLGIDEELIERTKKLAGKQNVELTELITKMGEEKAALARKNYQLDLNTALLQQKISEYEKKIAQFENEKKDIKKRSIAQAREFLTSLQKELNQEIDALKKTEKKDRQQIQKTLQKINKLNRDYGKLQDTLQNNKKPLVNPQIGQRVWIKDLDTEGEITDINSNKIKIDMDGIFFTTDKKKIYHTSAKKEKEKVASIKTPSKSVKMELMLLGNTFDEAALKLDSFIDDALYAGLKKIRIIHGKGTGALRNKIRNKLKKDKRISNFYTPPPEAGGTGVTIAELAS
ncbi:MAG: endonuclease MutS2 [Candidatus Cloacimonadota bacterium]|nr:endonuclease MutS2 [Candidatus Cloacimonadota bacterium]